MKKGQKTTNFINNVREKLLKGDQVVVTEVAREVGVTQTGATKIVHGKRFKRLVEEYFPPDLVLQTHKFFMQNTTLNFETFPKDMEDEKIKSLFADSSNFLREIVYDKESGRKRAYYLKPNVDAMHKGIDMIYKIQDRYADKTKMTVNINPLQEMDVDELKEKFLESYEEISKPKPSKNPQPMITSMDEFDRQAGNL